MDQKRLIACIIACFFVVLSLVPLQAESSADSGLLEVFYFYEHGCDACDAFKPVLDSLEVKYEGSIAVTRYDVFTAEGWDLYTSYGFTKIPALVIGTSVVQYESGLFTEEGISDIIDTALGGATVTLEYFYEQGCDACDAFKPALAQLKQKYGHQLVIEEIDVFTADGWSRFSTYGFLKTPSVVVGGTAKVEYPETTYERLDGLIAKALEGKSDNYSNITQWSIPVAFSLGFFSSFSPCLMAVLSFILAYTAGTSRKRSEAMGKSVLFGVGLVIMYTLIAVSMALLGRRLTNFKFYMSLVGSMITLLLGLNLLNYVFNVVEFPLSTKDFSKRMVYKFVSGKGYLGAVILGIIFSAVKLPCAAPALVVILTQIVDKGDMFFGMVLVSSFSLGVLLPFVLIGLISGGSTDVAKKVRWSGFFRLVVWGGGGIIVLAVSVWVLYTAFDLLPVITSTHFFVTLAAFTATLMIIVYALIMWRRKGPRPGLDGRELPELDD